MSDPDMQKSIPKAIAILRLRNQSDEHIAHAMGLSVDQIHLWEAEIALAVERLVKGGN